MSKPLPTFTINRRLWHRGKRKYPSALLVPQTGRMCCLGQIACQLGYSKEEIRDIDAPQNVSYPEKFRKHGIVYIGCCTVATDFVASMMQTNDNPDLADAEREAKLIALAKGHFRLVFIN